MSNFYIFNELNGQKSEDVKIANDETYTKNYISMLDYKTVATLYIKAVERVLEQLADIKNLVDIIQKNKGEKKDIQVEVKLTQKVNNVTSIIAEFKKGFSSYESPEAGEIINKLFHFFDVLETKINLFYLVYQEPYIVEAISIAQGILQIFQHLAKPILEEDSPQQTQNKDSYNQREMTSNPIDENDTVRDNSSQIINKTL